MKYLAGNSACFVFPLAIRERELFPVGGPTCLPECSVAAILEIYRTFDR